MIDHETPCIPYDQVREIAYRIPDGNASDDQSAAVNLLYWHLVCHYLPNSELDPTVLRAATNLAARGNVFGLKKVLTESNISDNNLQRAFIDAFISTSKGFYRIGLLTEPCQSEINSGIATDYNCSRVVPLDATNPGLEVCFNAFSESYELSRNKGAMRIQRVYIAAHDCQSCINYQRPFINFKEVVPSLNSGILFFLPVGLGKMCLDFSVKVALRFFSFFVPTKDLLSATFAVTGNNSLLPNHAFKVANKLTIDNVPYMDVFRQVNFLVWTSFSMAIKTTSYSKHVTHGYNINDDSNLACLLRESMKPETVVKFDAFLALHHLCHTTFHDISVSIDKQTDAIPKKKYLTCGLQQYRYKFYSLRKRGNDVPDTNMPFFISSTASFNPRDSIDCIECEGRINSLKTSNEKGGTAFSLCFKTKALKRLLMVAACGFLGRNFIELLAELPTGKANTTNKSLLVTENARYLSWLFNVHRLGFPEQQAQLRSTPRKNNIDDYGHEKMMYDDRPSKAKITSFLTNSVYIAFFEQGEEKRDYRFSKKFVTDTICFTLKQSTFSQYSSRENSRICPKTINMRGDGLDFIEAILTYKTYTKSLDITSRNITFLPEIQGANRNFCQDICGITNAKVVPYKLIKQFPEASKSPNFPAINMKIEIKDPIGMNVNLKHACFSLENTRHVVLHSLLYKALTFMCHKLSTRQVLNRIVDQTMDSVISVGEIDILKNEMAVRNERANYGLRSGLQSKFIDIVSELMWLSCNTNAEYQKLVDYIKHNDTLTSFLCYSSDIVANARNQCSVQVLGDANILKLNKVSNGRSFMSLPTQRTKREIAHKRKHPSARVYTKKHQEDPTKVLSGMSSSFKSRNGNFLNAIYENLGDGNGTIHFNSAVILEFVLHKRKLAMLRGIIPWHQETICLYEKQLYQFYGKS